MQSLKHRKRIEALFGWSKTVEGAAQAVYRGDEQGAVHIPPHARGGKFRGLLAV
ncbi:hypothetical protein [Poseidonocella sp. HB161398]|uniref:hypothetical protein n=1 Tax=Poseidonocella sp. HB161398 TaxID=2320855 RepID=UPI0014871A02